MAVFVLVWQQIILQVWQRFQAVIIFLLFPLSRVNIWKVKFDIQSPSHEYADIPTFTAFTLSSTFENNHNHQKSSFPSQVIVILTNAPFKGRYAHPPRDGGRVRCRKSSWWWNPFMRQIVFVYFCIHGESIHSRPIVFLYAVYFSAIKVHICILCFFVLLFMNAVSCKSSSLATKPVSLQLRIFVDYL